MGDMPGMGVNVPGVAIVGKPHQAMHTVLTPEALEFTAMLARCGCICCMPHSSRQCVHAIQCCACLSIWHCLRHRCSAGVRSVAAHNQ